MKQNSVTYLGFSENGSWRRRSRLTRERHLVSGSAVRSATMVRILDKQSAEFSIFTSEEWVPVMHRTRKLFPFSKGKQEYPHNGPKRRTHSDKWVRRWKLMLKNRKPEKRKKEKKKKKKKKRKKLSTIKGQRGRKATYRRAWQIFERRYSNCSQWRRERR